LLPFLLNIFPSVKIVQWGIFVEYPV
jgi:hypothetical protein